MTLQNLAEIGQLKPHDATADEVQRLLGAEIAAPHMTACAQRRYFAGIRAISYSRRKSAPISIFGSICWNAAYMIASRCSPE